MSQVQQVVSGPSEVCPESPYCEPFFGSQRASGGPATSAAGFPAASAAGSKQGFSAFRPGFIDFQWFCLHGHRRSGTSWSWRFSRRGAGHGLRTAGRSVYEICVMGCRFWRGLVHLWHRMVHCARFCWPAANGQEQKAPEGVLGGQIFEKP